jgi:hypothetical protein
MNPMNTEKRDRTSERGSAATKFVIILLFLVLVGNAGAHYVPVAYSAENFKQEMQTAVVNGMAVPSTVKPVDSVRIRIQKAAADNDIPNDMILDVKMSAQTVTAHVTYSRKVNILPFGMYVYDYRFDYTAIPSGYLLKDSKQG